MREESEAHAPSTHVGRGHALRRNAFWMLVGNAAYAVCLWATIAVLAKLGSAEAVGQFNLGFAIAGPIVLLLNLNLRALKATDALEEFPFPTYLSLRVICAAAAVAVTAIIVVLSDYEKNTRHVILAVALAKAFESVSDIVHGLLQKHEEMVWIAVSRIARGGLATAVVAIVFVASGQVLASTWGLVGAWLAVLLVLDLPVSRRFERLALSLDLDSLWRLFRTALPLGVVMMLINVNTNVPIYFLSAQYGEATVGYYSAVNYIGIAASTVAGAIAQAAAPRLGRMYAEGRPGAARRLLLKLVPLGLAMGGFGAVVAHLVGPELLSLLYTPEYADVAPVLEILMLAYGLGFAAAFLGVALTAQRSLRIMIPINLLTLVINVGLCWLLVPRSGMSGAAWSVGAALAFKLCANYWAAFRILTHD